jgi:hypothetical protein
MTDTDARRITTHWSVVLQAQGESPAAREPLEKLCRDLYSGLFDLWTRKFRPANRHGQWYMALQC